ncbi:hypothetical protein I3760_15G076300 [Carya illinoinensis]|nr:hypothetical protein I3760_15G076300 [Carya illinoinensis]
MSFRRRPRRQDSRVRDEDVERQSLNNDGVDSKEKKTTKTFLDPEGQFLRIWRMIFAVLGMMAVSVDPLFFYLPIDILAILPLPQKSVAQNLCTKGSFLMVLFSTNMCQDLSESPCSSGLGTNILELCG